MNWKTLTAIGLTVLAAGCSSRIAEFSIVATGNPQYEKMSSAPMARGVEGRDGRGWLLFIPLGGAPSLMEATNRCIDKGKGDFIERARVYETGWSIGLVSYGGYRVVGDVGDSKAPVAK